MSKVNVDGVMLFEQQFARVPYERYRKLFRASQKNIERDLGAVQSTANELIKRSQEGLDSATASKAIEGMITRVEGLKRKLSEMEETSGESTQAAMRTRLRHLSVVDNVQNTSDPEFIRWCDARLDRWLVDWALRSGKDETARAITQSKGIEQLVDIDIELFAEIRRIQDALKNQSCTEALAWCSENKAALRKIKSTLEFDLRLQEFIELNRALKWTEARAYCTKHLFGSMDTHEAQITQASALLAFGSTTKCGPYKRLYEPFRWDLLVSSFRNAIYTLNALPSQSLLSLSMYAGLAALKLPACFGDHVNKNKDCPVCDPSLGKLAEEVPLSYHVNSTIVCRITGRVMDGDNWPMMFPNGHAYSREAMLSMAARNAGIVTCPTTNLRCKLGDLKKLFVS